MPCAPTTSLGVICVMKIQCIQIKMETGNLISVENVKSFRIHVFSNLTSSFHSVSRVVHSKPAMEMLN